MARSSKTNEARLKNFWRKDGHEDLKNIHISLFKKKKESFFPRCSLSLLWTLDRANWREEFYFFISSSNFQVLGTSNAQLVSPLGPFQMTFMSDPCTDVWTCWIVWNQWDYLEFYMLGNQTVCLASKDGFQETKALGILV